LIDVVFEISGLADLSMAEIYREYKNSRININGKIKPYVFSDMYKKEHTPIIIYESNDYLARFNNWTVCDKLQIQENFIKYSYCEIWDNNTIFITGSLLLGSIYSILIMIGKVLKKQNNKSRIIIDLTIKANEKMMLRMQEQVMNIESIFFESYFYKNDKENKIKYYFDCINNTEINKFTNRFLGLFASENSKSNEPFLSVTLDETTKFVQSLLTYEHYLVIDN